MKNNVPLVNQRWVLVAVALYFIFVSGCASIPPVFSQISWALSGASYVTTSKGPSDHVISLAMKKDCSLFRLIKIQPICRPVTENTNQSIFSLIMSFLKKPAKKPAPASGSQAVTALAP